MKRGIIVMGEIGMLRLCGWAALIMEWVLRFLVPVFLGLIAIFGAWCIIVFVCALIGAIRRRRRAGSKGRADRS